MATSASAAASSAAAAMVARARRDVQEHFEQADAFDPERAIGYEPTDHLHERQLNHLVVRGIVRATVDGRYWTDRDALRLEQERRRRTIKLLAVIVASIIGVAIVAAAGIVLLIGR